MSKTWANRSQSNVPSQTSSLATVDPLFGRIYSTGPEENQEKETLEWSQGGKALGGRAEGWAPGGEDSQSRFGRGTFWKFLIPPPPPQDTPSCPLPVSLRAFFFHQVLPPGFGSQPQPAVRKRSDHGHFLLSVKLNRKRAQGKQRGNSRGKSSWSPPETQDGKRNNCSLISRPRLSQ